MRSNQRLLSVTAILSLPLCLGCSSAGCAVAPGDDIPDDDIPADTIPLDGRGGGVLAYTLQPGPNSGLHEIHAMNADGTADRRLVEASIGLNHHDWSPDARRIATGGYYGETTSVHTFDVDGQNLTRLTDEAGVVDNEPTWSPDGSMIAFSRVYIHEGYRSEIWVMNADGSDQHSIGVDGFTVRWSPDGTRFIYQSTVTQWTGIQSDIMTCNADGSDVRRVTGADGNELTPNWSPDGARIAFVADYDGDYDVYVMDADGAGTHRLTETTVDDFAPRWSPDGSRIAFFSDASGTGQWEVYVIGADGSDLRRVTYTTAPRTSINPVWRPAPA